MTLAVISRVRMVPFLKISTQFALYATITILFSNVIHKSYAESVSYAGRDFPVDSLRELDGGNVTSEVGGQQLLASRSTVGRAVFKIYAQRPELLAKTDDLRGYGSWLATLPSKGDEDGTVLAVTRFVESGGIDLPDKLRFYTELVANPEGERVLLKALSSIERGSLGSCSALAYVSLEKQPSVKNAASQPQSWFSSVCPQSLVLMAQRMMMEGDRASGEAMLRAATLVCAGGEVGDAARLSLERLEALDKALQSQDLEQLDSALQIASFDALLSEYFETRRPDIVAEFSSRALREGRPTDALRGLSLLELSHRNNVHHELVSKALGELTFEDRAVLQLERIRTLIWSYATKDDAVRQQYITTLETWIQRSLKDRKPGEGTILLAGITELRLDPSVENDALRGAIAESFVDEGDERSADMVLGGVRSELPWIYRFRLLLKRDIYMLIMVTLGCVVILRWAFMFIARMKRRSLARRIARDAERRAAEAAERERFHSQLADDALRSEAFMDVDEYAATLKKFQLHPSASIADIKNAYRHVIKTLHPDLNPNVSREDTDRFIDLTKAYERLLVLHAERERRSKPST